jgi:hypothetical protein
MQSDITDSYNRRSMNNNLETREDENINENGEIIYNDFTK